MPEDIKALIDAINKTVEEEDAFRDAINTMIAASLARQESLKTLRRKITIFQNSLPLN